jgi:hypothetical protein
MESFNLQRLWHHSQVCSAPSLLKKSSIIKIVDILHVIKNGDFMNTLEKYYIQLKAKKEIILMTNA